MTGSWWSDAACARVGGDAWFPDGGRTVTAQARAICASCPVTTPCLDYALRHRITEGMWGGRTPNERRRLRPVAA